MGNLKPLNGWILLEKYNKIKKKEADSPFAAAVAVSNTNLGEVLFEQPDSDLKAGDLVYFVGNVQKLILENAKEVLAVKAENIVAKAN